MKIRANENEKLNILVLSDIQDYKPVSKKYQEALYRIIETVKPQIIVLHGDMIFGPLVLSKKRAEKIIDSILEPINRAGIPFTFIFGNHDLDTIVKDKFQMGIYKESPYCITPSFDEREISQGYYIDVYKNDESEVLTRLVFTDSGATKFEGLSIEYIGPKEETISWCDKVINESKSFVCVFQHVPVFSIYKMLKEAESREELIKAVKCHSIFKGKKMVLNRKLADGVLGEAPCPPFEKDDIQFLSWKRSKKVYGAVFGHDHKNYFTGVLEGIKIIQLPTCGLNCYGSEGLRAAGLITITDKYDITSELFYIKDYLGEGK